MKKDLKIKYLKTILDRFKYCNNMAPFPVYDTEYLEMLNKDINEMEKLKKKNYDEDSVTSCKYCKSLYIVLDEHKNNICMQCGSINETKEYENIYAYLKDKEDKSNEEY